VCVYIEEAHPTDGWSIEWNSRQGVNVAKAKSLDEKVESASLFAGALNVPMEEIVVDAMDEAASKAYKANPERLFIVTDGVVRYCGGIGPFGYVIEEVRAWLKHEQKNANV